MLARMWGSTDSYLLITGVIENDIASLKDTWAVSHKTLQTRCYSLLDGGGVSVNGHSSYMSRAEDNLRCHSLGTSCLLFWGLDFSLVSGLSSWVSFKGHPIFAFPVLGLQVCVITLDFYTWILES